MIQSYPILLLCLLSSLVASHSVEILNCPENRTSSTLTELQDNLDWLWIHENVVSPQTQSSILNLVNLKRNQFHRNDEGYLKYQYNLTSEDASLETMQTLVDQITPLLGLDRKELDDKDHVIMTIQTPGYELTPHQDLIEGMDKAMYTVLVYLTEVAEKPEFSGYTAFEQAGFTIRPKPGRVVVWRNLDREGHFMPRATHRGMQLADADAEEKVFVTFSLAYSPKVFAEVPDAWMQAPHAHWLNMPSLSLSGQVSMPTGTDAPTTSPAVGGGGPNLPAGFCRPRSGLHKRDCRRRERLCRQVNAPMKWTGRGCRLRGLRGRFGDGGCQCRDYCGYNCQGRCQADPICAWQGGVCVVKATGLPGGPIPDCSLP